MTEAEEATAASPPNEAPESEEAPVVRPPGEEKTEDTAPRNILANVADGIASELAGSNEEEEAKNETAEEAATEKEATTEENNNNEENNQENPENVDNTEQNPEDTEQVTNEGEQEKAETTNEENNSEGSQGKSEQETQTVGVLEDLQQQTLEPLLPPIENLKTPYPPSARRTAPRTPSSARTRNSYRNSAPSYQIIKTVPEPSSVQKKLMERAMNGEQLVGLSDETYEELLFNLSQLRKKTAIQHRYRDGYKINEAIRSVTEIQTNARKQSMQKQAMTDYKQAMTDFQTECQEFDSETKKMEKELQNELKRQREEMKKSHQYELEEHHEHWSSPAKYRQYNRASNQLTVLRRQQAFLLVQCRFKDAEQVQSLIDQRTREEEAQNHKSHQHDYEESLKFIRNKQKNEVDFFEEKAQVQLTQFRQKRAAQRQVYEKREKRLEARNEVVRDLEKLWNSAQLQRIESVSQTNTREVQTFQPSSKMSRKDIKDQDVAILSLPPLTNPISRKHKRSRED